MFFFPIDHVMRDIATLAFVFFIAVILTLLVEIPFLNLDKIWFPSREKTHHQNINQIKEK